MLRQTSVPEKPVALPPPPSPIKAPTPASPTDEYADLRTALEMVNEALSNSKAQAFIDEHGQVRAVIEVTI